MCDFALSFKFGEIIKDTWAKNIYSQFEKKTSTTKLKQHHGMMTTLDTHIELFKMHSDVILTQEL